VLLSTASRTREGDVVAEDSIEPGRPPVRASDGDRQRVVELLREHTSAGRLTIEEYEQRVDAAYAAKTISALRPLLADLPVHLEEVLPPEVPARSAPPRWQPGPAGAPEPDQAGSESTRWVLLVVAVVVLLGMVLLAVRGVFVFWPLFIGGMFIFRGGLRRGPRHHRR